MSHSERRSPMHHPDFEQFKLLVEQLEMIRTLFGSDSAIHSKVAIILLDNLADTFMYRQCLNEFENDAQLIMIQPPRFSPERRREAIRDFKSKISLLSELGFLDSEDGTVLRIGHSYRNAAYHRDSHNHRALKELGRILLRSVCNLCCRYYENGVSLGGFEPQQWLAEHRLRTDFINFKSASSSICAELLKGLPCELQTSKSAFLEDVSLRVAEIERQLRRLELDDLTLDDGLKRADFAEAHPWENYSKELRNLNYQIVEARLSTGSGASLDPDSYRAAQTLANKRVAKALKAFKPISSLSLLRQVMSSRRLSKAASLENLLLGYQDLDAKLTRMERSVDLLVEAVDRAVQHEIDLSRGK